MQNRHSLLIKIIIAISAFIIGILTTLMIIKIILYSKEYNYLDQNNINNLSSAVSKVYDSVVLIQSHVGNNINSSGTGFIYKKDSKYGYIITNQHVINNSTKITAITSDEKEVELTLLGQDRYLDLAVLRIKKMYVKQVAKISSSKKMQLGDAVFTVGSPLGYNYRGSVTTGVLSGKNRQVTVDEEDQGMEMIMDVLQIDASINPGNSGGPVLNSKGEVIGICSLKLVDDKIEGMGFAIPIEDAMPHIEILEKNENIKRPLLGIEIINYNDSANLLKNELEVPEDLNMGVVIINVSEDTVSSKAGLKKGDIIVKIDDDYVKNISHMRYLLYKHKVGDKVMISYIRGNKKQKTKIHLTDVSN